MMAGIMLSGLTACSDDWEEEYYDEYGEEDKPYVEDNSSAGRGGASVLKGLSLQVNESDGRLVISREKPDKEGETGEEGVWTIFVYLCGTDLESQGGSATDDLEEMLASSESDRVRFVVQTGGASDWYRSEVDKDNLQRFVIQNGKMELVEEQPKAAMGTIDTLSDFLTWGTKQYLSEHMGLIFWNHGGGSITGVCFDENYDNDSLDLTEVDNALYENLKSSGRKYDFVGFDACLMGSVEMANILATYSEYMIGSEELEPGSGWDYTALGNFLAEKPDSDGAALGKAVCDSYLEECERAGDSDIATLSVVNLSRIDDLLVSFNAFAKNMFEAAEDDASMAEIVRGIEEADNFGGNNKSEGYTNMVDLDGILTASAEYADGADAAKKALADSITYSVSGSNHKTAGGLSMYYPLMIQGSNELTMFGKVCVSPYYLSFVDRQNHTGVAGGQEEEYQYDDGSWFDDDGEWYGADSNEDSYWDYLDGYEQTGESPYISFEVEPSINEEGVFSFKLDEEGYYNTASVCAMVYEIAEDGNTMIELGETINLQEDWGSGTFADQFDGYWMSLPDGQNLATYIAEMTDEYLIYTSPILLNGKETNLRMKRYYDDGTVTVEGAWEGISEDGCAARDIVKLKNGDKIVPIYYSYNMEGEDEAEYEGDEFTVSGDTEIFYGMMPVGDYLYAFCIDDIYGDYYMSDTVEFHLDEDGEVSFR